MEPEKTRNATWSARLRYLTTREFLLHFFLIANLIVLRTFFPLREAKNEKIYKKETATKANAQVGKGRIDLPRAMIRNQRASFTTDASSTNDYKLVGARSELPNFNLPLRLALAFLYYYNVWLLVKNLLVTLMRSPSYAWIRFLDCYLLGRFVVNGRAIEVSSTCGCFLTVVQLSWINLILSKKSELRMPCVEFLLKSPKEVQRWSSTKTYRDSSRAESKQRSLDDDRKLLHSTIFEFRNPFKIPSNDHRRETDAFKVRLNRTLESWNRLSQSIMNYHIFFVPFITVVILYFLRMITPVMISRRGFESNYRYCLQWLKSDNKTSPVGGQLAWTKSFFFDLVRPSPQSYAPSGFGELSKKTQFKVELLDEFWPPFGELVPWTYYHVIRASMDMFDTVVLYSQTAFMLSAMGLFAIVMINDLVNYGEQLNKLLKEHVMMLRYRNAQSGHLQLAIFGAHKPDRQEVSLTAELKYLQDASLEIQAQVVEMFSLMKIYNEYIQYQTVWLVSLWLSYSFLVTSWIFLPGNDAPKIEWYFVHFTATSFLFIFMAAFAEVKKSFNRMYKEMSTAMALDDDFKFGKLIWLSLLRFYTPIPLYCFTFITKIHIDLMFGFKLIAWLASALLVTASFFVVYH